MGDLSVIKAIFLIKESKINLCIINAKNRSKFGNSCEDYIIPFLSSDILDNCFYYYVGRKHESESGQQRIAPRNIDHPVFFNVSGNEAEERLAEMPQGEAIIRPSKEVCWSFYATHLFFIFTGLGTTLVLNPGDGGVKPIT